MTSTSIESRGLSELTSANACLDDQPMMNTQHLQSLVDFQKMVFIYNALLTGWTVRMIGPDQFEFVKPTTNIKREVNLDDYLRKFIQYNLNIENALK